MKTTRLVAAALLVSIAFTSNFARAQALARPAAPSARPVAPRGAPAARAIEVISPRASTAMTSKLGLDVRTVGAHVAASIESYRHAENFSETKVAQTIEAIAIGLKDAAETASPAIITLTAEQRVAAERLLMLGAHAAMYDTAVARKVVQMAAHGLARGVVTGRTAGEQPTVPNPSAAAFQISTLVTRIIGAGQSMTPQAFDNAANAAFRAHVVKPGTETPVTGVLDPDLDTAGCFG